MIRTRRFFSIGGRTIASTHCSYTRGERAMQAELTWVGWFNTKTAVYLRTVTHPIPISVQTRST